MGVGSEDALTLQRLNVRRHQQQHNMMYSHATGMLICICSPPTVFVQAGGNTNMICDEHIASMVPQ